MSIGAAPLITSKLTRITERSDFIWQIMSAVRVAGERISERFLNARAAIWNFPLNAPANVPCPTARNTNVARVAEQKLMRMKTPSASLPNKSVKDEFFS